jgi:hypothetical protein
LRVFRGRSGLEPLKCFLHDTVRTANGIFFYGQRAQLCVLCILTDKLHQSERSVSAIFNGAHLVVEDVNVTSALFRGGVSVRNHVVIHEEGVVMACG